MKCGRPKPKGEQAAGAEGGSAGGREGLRGRQLSPLARASVNAAEQSGLWGLFFLKKYICIYITGRTTEGPGVKSLWLFEVHFSQVGWSGVGMALEALEVGRGAYLCQAGPCERKSGLQPVWDPAQQCVEPR